MRNIILKTTELKGKSKEDLAKLSQNFYKNYLQGNKVINIEKGITIFFSKLGKNKSARSSVTPEKAIIIFHLFNILKHAKFSNFGMPKPKHIQKFSALGFFNFKIIIEIDGKVKFLRLPVMLKNNGLFQYSINLYNV